jgi:macrodomain Ter protein organizer (MatP/YcbG family)
MAHKRIVNGKEYVYDYAQIYIKKSSHKQLRKMAHKLKKTTSETIDFLVKNYEGNI